MIVTEFSRQRTPPNGWQFREPSTGWTAPTPIGSTFSQTVDLIIAMRRKNPAITAKFNLATNPEVVASELEKYNRKRLGLPEEATPPPFLESHRRSSGAGAAAVAVDAMAGLKRAASGTAVIVDWLKSGGAPVAQELANKRAAICVTCPKNVAGSWFTTAPAELIKETLEARKDLKLETPSDAQLKSCDVCKCLMRLKVWTPLEFILKRTKPEVMAEFPARCWIARHE